MKPITRKRLLRFVQFARAIASGALYMVLFSKGRPSKLLAIAKVTIGRIKAAKERGGRGPILGKVRGCYRCPLFRRDLRVCGNMSNPTANVKTRLIWASVFLQVSIPTIPTRRIPFGCRCWIPLKATDPDAMCFLADPMYGLGLNGYWPTPENPNPRHEWALANQSHETLVPEPKHL